MVISDKEKNILENRQLGIYESDDFYELEQWTNGGVDMIINIFKNGSPLKEQLIAYVDNFDIDEEINCYRQDEDYKTMFTIKESLEDFEGWLNYIKSIIDDLESE